MLKDGQYNGIRLHVVKDGAAVADHFAHTMADIVQDHNARKRPTRFIMPVGPTDQYQVFARLCNEHQIDLSNFHMFNMDEYVGDDGRNLPDDHPFSFAYFLRENFYRLVDAKCRLNRRQMHIPNAANLADYTNAMQAVGGIDVCFGGIGINGHIAFNESLEYWQVATNDAFKNLPTRVISLAATTTVVNAIFGTGGNLQAVPKLAVTVGMKEILASKKIRIYLDWPWQKQALRNTLLGPVTPMFPASFLQEHDDVAIVAAECVAQEPSLAPE